MKPLIHFAGMPRTGTTFFYYYLRQHPSLWTPVRKETNYFSVEHGRGDRWFKNLYKKQPDGQVGLDVSPIYFMDPAVPERLKSFNPEAKVVIGIRKASDWLVSAYKQKTTQNMSIPPFEEFVEHFDWNIRSHVLPVTFHDDFVTRQVAAYQEAFGEHVLIYDYAWFRKNPLAMINVLEKFAGVETYFHEGNFENKVINASQRQTNRLLNVFLTQDWVIDAITKLFPDRLIMKVKNRYFGEGSAKKTPKPAAKPAENVEAHQAWEALASARFAEEDARIAALFAEHPVWVGKTPFAL